MYISTAPIGRISAKFGIGKFYENLSTSSKFGEKLAKISGTLREDVSRFYSCQRHKFATKA
jgi:hypothetical protein